MSLLLNIQPPISIGEKLGSQQNPNPAAIVNSSILDGVSIQHAGSGYVRLGVDGSVVIRGAQPDPTTKRLDSPPEITRSFECKGIDPQGRTADFVASTDAIDAHDEIVDQSTWQLQDYLTNPVVLFAHNSRDLPIGTCVDVAVRNNRLECRIKFASEDMNPLAEQVWKMVQARILRAVSVGFVPSSYRIEMRDGREVLVWSDCVLKEISVVPVPANPEALAKTKAKALEREAGTASAPAITTKASPPVAGHQPSPAKTETKMSEDNKELVAKVEELTTKNSQLALDAGAANGRADAAEKALRELEPKVKTLETENAALKSQTKTLADERDAAVKERDELLAKTIEQEVDALVGKKITADEKPLFVDLRKSNPELFTKMIAQRQPMRLEEQVVPAPKTNGASNDDLVAELKSV